MVSWIEGMLIDCYITLQGSAVDPTSRKTLSRYQYQAVKV